MLLELLATVIVGYVLGSIPVGYLAGRLLAHVDVRRVGSGRTGGSNVLRSAGVVPAALTVLGDVGKGYGAILLARWISADLAVGGALAGLAVVAGHNWSAFLGLRGGVGTATTLGAALALAPMPAGVATGAGLISVAIWRHTSLGSLTVAAVLTLACGIGAALGALPGDRALFALGAGLMSLWELRPNIERLRRGTERKLGQSIPTGARDVPPEARGHRKRPGLPKDTRSLVRR